MPLPRLAGEPVGIPSLKGGEGVKNHYFPACFLGASLLFVRLTAHSPAPKMNH